MFDNKKMPLQLREPHGRLFGPERRNANTDAVDKKSRVGRLLRHCRWFSILLHDTITSGSPMWRYKYEFPDTHNTHAHAHAHAELYVHATLLFRVRKLTSSGRLLAAALHSLHTHTDLLFSCPFTRNSVAVFIQLQCVGDTMSWLSGWASL